MTTIVFDRTGGVVCSDSRWSILGSFGIVYTDDAPFYKIAVTPDQVWLFAGNALQIDGMKQYLQKYPNVAGRPAIDLKSIDRMAIIVAGKDGQLIDYHQPDIVMPNQQLPEFVAAGTGSLAAAEEWGRSTCPKLAVEAAKTRDVSSGGQLMYFNLITHETNVGQCHGIGCVTKALIEKGKVMFINDAQVYTFEEAAKRHPDVKKLYDSAATGGLSAQVQAPCDAMYNSASDDQKRGFLAKVGIPVAD